MPPSDPAAPPPPPLPTGAPGVPPAYAFPPPSYGGAYTPPFAPLPYRPRVWTVFVVFLVALIAGSIGAGIVAVVMAVVLHGPEVLNRQAPDNQERLQAVLREPVVFLPTLATTPVILAAVALGAAYLSPVPARRRLRLGRPALPWYGYPIVAVGTLAIGLTCGVLIEMLGLGDEGVLKEFERVFTGMRGGLLVVTAAVIGLAPGFGEEFLFRGYAQTRLRQRWPRGAALLVTSLLFGLLHMDLVQGTMVVFLGLWLGEVSDRTGSVWPAVVGHTFNNATATVLGALAGEAGEAGESWKALLVSVPVILACLAYVLRRPIVEIEPDPTPQSVPPALPMPSPYYMPPPGTF